MSDKLKPCPFCGGKAVFTNTQIYRYKVLCSSCSLMLPSQPYEYFTHKKYAIEAWNTRHEQELKEQLEEVFKRR